MVCYIKKIDCTPPSPPKQQQQKIDFLAKRPLVLPMCLLWPWKAIPIYVSNGNIWCIENFEMNDEKKRFQTFFSSLNLQSKWKRWQKWLLLFLGFLTDSKQTKVSEWIWFSSFIQIVFLSSSNFLQQNIDFGYSQDQHLVIFLRSRQTKFFTQTLFASSVPSIHLFVRDASSECEKSKRLVLLIRYFGDA